MLMRGGTSKGVYLLAEDLPDDVSARNDLLLRIMGSPDPRQIDGLGGAASLTSKAAIVWPSSRADVDVDYLFLQVGVDEPYVSDQQNCGNLLAGVGPFAVERGLVHACDPVTSVRIRMVNSDTVGVATFPTPYGHVQYSGDTAISGVPGTAAEVSLRFKDLAGSVTRSLLPTGQVRDVIDSIEVTCVDNGMPVVVAEASSFDLTGYESPAELGAMTGLIDKIQAIRLQAGELMGLGDVRQSSVPKTTLVAPPRDGGMLCTRSFIPLRPHSSIGVFGALSVVTGIMLDGAVGRHLTDSWGDATRVDVEHPTGHLHVDAIFGPGKDGPQIVESGFVRTARKLFDGVAFPRDGAA